MRYRMIAVLAAALLSMSATASKKPAAPAVNGKDAEDFARAEWNWHSIGRGAEAGYAQFQMFGSTQSIAVVRYKASRYDTDIFSCHGSDRSITSRAGKARGAVAALNGSYFNVKTLYPTTFVKDDGVQVGHTTADELFRVNGAFCLKNPRRGCVIELSDTSSYVAGTAKYHEAIASGPVLIDDGKAMSYDRKDGFYAKRHPRTMIGVDGKGWIYLVVVDGRFPGQGDGATIAEMVVLAGCFGLVDALNLDGGGSSTLWTAADGVINHPYDNKKFDGEGERQIPNIIMMMPRRSR